jgi:hypothetical protein
VSGWWLRKARQTVRHLTGRVTAPERNGLEDWLTPAQLALFDAMHPADQRHGLDVVAWLRSRGHEDPELLLAGLLHDCAKGPEIRLWHRVTWALVERYGEGMSRMTAWLPGFDTAFEVLRRHAESSAELALRAGCTPRTAELIRHQDEPIDPISGTALRRADEAS